MSLIFKLAKSNGETWFEHSKNTYHVGRILWDLCQKELSRYFSQDEYLWCCLFHDIGKFLWKEFADVHTPYTSQALGHLRVHNDYQNLLGQFLIQDHSDDQRLISAIEDHHDNKVKGSEFITLADCVASSDYGYLSELETGTYSSYLKFLISDLQGIHGFYLIKISFPESSHLDRVKFGQLFLIKMLREAVWHLCTNTPSCFYLFDTPNGCKVITKTEPSQFKTEVDNQFLDYLTERFKDFDLKQLVGGQPQAFYRLRQYVPKEMYAQIEDVLFQSCLIDCLVNIGRSNRIKEIPKKPEMEQWTDDELSAAFEQYTGINKKALQKIKKLHLPWLGHANQDKTFLTKKATEFDSKVSKKDENKIGELKKCLMESLKEQPVIVSLLRREQVFKGEPKYLQCLVDPIAKYIIRKNSFLRNGIEAFSIQPIVSFISINNRLPAETYSTSSKETCAACGIFAKYLEAGPIVTGFSKQQWRETLGSPESPQPLCPMCYFSLLIYTFLTGTEKGQNVRPLEASYLTLLGLHSFQEIQNFVEGTSLIGESITKRLEGFKKQFNLQKPIVYIPQITDLDMIIYPIIPKTDALKDYPSIQRYSILSEIQDISLASKNILGVALQDKPLIKGPSIINTPEGEIDLESIRPRLELFNFVRDITYDPKSLIFYMRLWQQNPAVALSRIVKESTNSKRGIFISQENFRKGVNMIPKDDKNFVIVKKLWDIISGLQQLPSGRGSKYEIGRPLKKFRGTPESFDLTLNFLLKDAFISFEQKEKALSLAKQLREELLKLSKEEQRDLGNYAKKTTHLFSNLAWQEVKQKGEKKDG